MWRWGADGLATSLRPAEPAFDLLKARNESTLLRSGGDFAEIKAKGNSIDAMAFQLSPSPTATGRHWEVADSRP
jgi:hypothetical protein